jgi:hypothetical protein
MCGVCSRPRELRNEPNILTGKGNGRRDNLNYIDIDVNETEYKRGRIEMQRVVSSCCQKRDQSRLL